MHDIPHIATREKDRARSVMPLNTRLYTGQLYQIKFEQLTFAEMRRDCVYLHICSYQTQPGLFKPIDTTKPRT
jgi:hypothetical protein